MSSITFPSNLSHVSASHGNNESFYQESFDPQGTSSFQMNPLSLHPPRTPRTSIAYSYNSDATVDNRDESKLTMSIDVNDLDEDDIKTQSQKARVSREEIWRELVKSSYGRDKSLKLIQYAIKVYLLLHLGFKSRYSSAGNRNSPPWERSIVRRLDSTVAGLSLTRKCLLLFNWLAPLTVIRAQQSVPYSTESLSPTTKRKKTRPLLHAILHTSPPVLLELANAVADDVYTWSRLGLLGKRTGSTAEKCANWFWFASTLVNLVENTVERGVLRELQHEVEGRSYTESMTMGATAKSNPAASKVDEDELKRLHKRDYWLVMSRNKLLMDLIFVSYDCFGVKRAKRPVQAFTGLAAAIISTAKIYSQEQNIIASKS